MPLSIPANIISKDHITSIIDTFKDSKGKKGSFFRPCRWLFTSKVSIEGVIDKIKDSVTPNQEKRNILKCLIANPRWLSSNKELQAELFKTLHEDEGTTESGKLCRLIVSLNKTDQVYKLINEPQAKNAYLKELLQVEKAKRIEKILVKSPLDDSAKAALVKEDFANWCIKNKIASTLPSTFSGYLLHLLKNGTIQRINHFDNLSKLEGFDWNKISLPRVVDDQKNIVRLLEIVQSIPIEFKEKIFIQAAMEGADEIVKAGLSDRNLKDPCKKAGLVCSARKNKKSTSQLIAKSLGLTSSTQIDFYQSQGNISEISAFSNTMGQTVGSTIGHTGESLIINKVNN